MLPPPALLRRLEHRLPLLQGGAADQPVRLQTMRDAIAWTYDLLAEDEARLFRRLAVFVGGFTLEAAEGSGPPGRRPRLASRRQQRGPARRVVRTGRQEPGAAGPSDGQSRATVAGDGARVRAGAAGRQRRGGGGPRRPRRLLPGARRADGAAAARTGARAGFAALEREHGNLRAALAWFETPARPRPSCGWRRRSATSGA